MEKVKGLLQGTAPVWLPVMGIILTGWLLK